MLSPWLSRKKVCSPNMLFSSGTTGWLSGMTSPSNWVRVRSTCADVNFIAHSFRLGLCRLGSYPNLATLYCTLRGLPPQVVKRYAQSFRLATHRQVSHGACHQHRLYRVPEIVTRGRFPDGSESDST